MVAWARAEQHPHNTRGSILRGQLRHSHVALASGVRPVCRRVSLFAVDITVIEARDLQGQGVQHTYTSTSHLHTMLAKGGNKMGPLP